MYTTAINLYCFTVKLKTIFGSKFYRTDAKTRFRIINNLFVFYYLNLGMSINWEFQLTKAMGWIRLWFG